MGSIPHGSEAGRGGSWLTPLCCVAQVNSGTWTWDLGDMPTPLPSRTAARGVAGGAAGRWRDRVTRLHSWPVCQRRGPPLCGDFGDSQNWGAFENRGNHGYEGLFPPPGISRLCVPLARGGREILGLALCGLPDSSSQMVAGDGCRSGVLLGIVVLLVARHASKSPML